MILDEASFTRDQWAEVLHVSVGCNQHAGYPLAFACDCIESFEKFWPEDQTMNLVEFLGALMWVVDTHANLK